MMVYGPPQFATLSLFPLEVLLQHYRAYTESISHTMFLVIELLLLLLSLLNVLTCL